MELNCFKPSVSPKWLMITAGAFWSIVGISLCSVAYHWLIVIQPQHIISLEILAIILALLAGHLIFAKIAAKNIARLIQFPGKRCFFSFQSWKSYLNIMFMIGLGYYLRHSLFPKSYLAVIYTVVGGGLFIASFKYYIWLWIGPERI